MRPLHGEAGRSSFLAAAAAGHTVVVAGSSWPAVELAAAAADAAQLRGNSESAGQQGSY